MTLTRRLTAARPTSRAARLLDEVVDAAFDGPDPLDGSGVGEDDSDDDLFDALDGLAQRVGNIERVLARVRLLGEPTAAPDEWLPRSAGKHPVKPSKPE